MFKRREELLPIPTCGFPSNLSKNVQSAEDFYFGHVFLSCIFITHFFFSNFQRFWAGGGKNPLTDSYVFSKNVSRQTIFSKLDKFLTASRRNYYSLFFYLFIYTFHISLSFFHSLIRKSRSRSLASSPCFVGR